MATADRAEEMAGVYKTLDQLKAEAWHEARTDAELALAVDAAASLSSAAGKGGNAQCTGCKRRPST